MKITVALGPFLPAPPGAAGAVERIWGEVLPHLVDAGHEVTVISKALEPGEAFPEKPGLSWIELPGYDRTGNVWKDMALDAVYSRRVMKALPPSDVVVANSFWLPVFASRQRGRKHAVVYTMQRFPKKHFKMYGKLDAVHAVSSAVAEALDAIVPSLSGRTHIVPNPINAAVFRVTRPIGTETGQTVLYTGRLHPEKGVELLVEACAKLAPTHEQLRLRLVGVSSVEQGGGGPAYIEKLTSLAGDALALEFVPPVFDREALADTLRGCDVYCYPSVADRGESFGVAPLEAMAVGCPVVLSGLACFKQFADDGRTALVFDHRGPDPVGALAGRLERLLGDPALRETLGKAAAAEATKFDNSAIARGYLDVFQKAVDRHRSRSAG